MAGGSLRPLRKVLVVDDSRLGLSLLEELFEPYRVTLERAADGEEAWRRLEQLEPDLVLSDILMPRLDGLGLARRIRAREGRPQPVVILTTALSVRTELRMEARRAGADAILPKPLTSAALRTALEAHFDLLPEPAPSAEVARPPAPRALDQPVAAPRRPTLPPPAAPAAVPEAPSPLAPRPAPRPPQAPLQAGARRSSERDVDSLLAEALGDLAPRK